MYVNAYILIFCKIVGKIYILTLANRLRHKCSGISSFSSLHLDAPYYLRNSNFQLMFMEKY